MRVIIKARIQKKWRHLKCQIKCAIQYFKFRRANYPESLEECQLRAAFCLCTRVLTPTTNKWRLHLKKRKTQNDRETRWRMSFVCGIFYCTGQIRCEKFLYILCSQSVKRVHPQLTADQFEVSECTLPGPSVGDVTEEGVVACCHPPLAWDKNGKTAEITITFPAIWAWCIFTPPQNVTQR